METINLIISEWVQSFRNDFLDAFFLFITEFGDETVFLILAAFIYWTIDKKYAYRLIMFFLYGAVLNGSLKFLTNSPRPHVEFPERIDLVGAGSGGTSLPSGHAQNSTILALTLNEKKAKIGRWFTPFLTVMVIFVMLSRIYLGEHYLTDVIFGYAIAFTFYTLVNQFLIKKTIPSWLPFLPFILMIPVALLTNDKNVYVAFASLIGFTVGYQLESRWIKFQEKGTWHTALIKMALGIGIALTLRIGLKELFSLGLYSADFEANPILTDQLLDFIRYFVIAIWMTLGAPWVFKLILKSDR
ncbi:MAG: phosphatase PAP2 family protein [Bacilli bacterium]